MQGDLFQEGSEPEKSGVSKTGLSGFGTATETGSGQTGKSKGRIPLMDAILRAAGGRGRIVLNIDGLAGAPPLEYASDFVADPPKARRQKKHEKEWDKAHPAFEISVASARDLVRLRDLIGKSFEGKAYPFTYLEFAGRERILHTHCIDNAEGFRSIQHSVDYQEPGYALVQGEKRHSAMGFPRLVRIRSNPQAEARGLRKKWAEYAGIELDGQMFAFKDPKLQQLVANSADGKRFDFLAVPVFYSYQDKGGATKHSIVWTINEDAPRPKGFDVDTPDILTAGLEDEPA